ncbi:unnamed protein product [Cuscuta epithymum]|uniref:Uncharacterized protein n=1 Tax=Cuscuta epithymum TaxID=186058 RepID=A0AAV0DQR8_9ASTE|nr:unnamed protein product [Cuscuta epithymum]CAH9142369.1 unnamed protein product [Cuscuta epithymum]
MPLYDATFSAIAVDFEPNPDLIWYKFCQLNGIDDEGARICSGGGREADKGRRRRPMEGGGVECRAAAAD